MYLNEGSLLNNLRIRYEKDQIYVSAFRGPRKHPNNLPFLSLNNPRPTLQTS